MSPKMPSTTSTRTVVNTVRNPAHVGEAEAAALHRLAAQARDKGVKIVIDEDNRHWATSASRPGERYVVSLLSCSCAGFVRHGRCHHFGLILAEYHSLPPVEPDNGGPDTGPDGGGAAVAVPSTSQTGADVVLAVVPAVSPVERANRTAIAAYLDSERSRSDYWTLTGALLGEDYFTAGGMTDRALEVWCRTRLGIPTTELVCPSSLCCGRGVFQCHPEGDQERCHTCRGSGVIPGHSVVAIVDEEVARAA